MVYNDTSSGALNVWATHTAVAGDLSSFTPAQRVKPSGQTQFFPWLQSAPNGRVDLAYYDRSCDADRRPQLRHAVVVDGLRRVVDEHAGDHAAASTATRSARASRSSDPPNCTNFFLGDYIAVASTNTKAQVMWTGNGDAHPRRFHREGRFLT